MQFNPRPDEARVREVAGREDLLLERENGRYQLLERCGDLLVMEAPTLDEVKRFLMNDVLAEEAR